MRVFPKHAVESSGPDQGDEVRRRRHLDVEKAPAYPSEIRESDPALKCDAVPGSSVGLVERFRSELARELSPHGWRYLPVAALAGRAAGTAVPVLGHPDRFDEDRKIRIDAMLRHPTERPCAEGQGEKECEEGEHGAHHTRFSWNVSSIELEFIECWPVKSDIPGACTMRRGDRI